MGSMRTITNVFVISILFVPVTYAQQSTAPVAAARDAAAKTVVAANNELPDRPLHQLPTPSYKGPLPSHGYYLRDGEIYPKFGFRQVADKNFWMLAVALPAAASAFDGVTTFHAIALGNSEGNPLFGAHPIPGRVAGIKAGVGFLSATSMYFLKREDMQYDYKGWKRDGFPGRWSKMALLAPAFWLALGAHNLTLGRQPPANAGPAVAMQLLRHR